MATSEVWAGKVNTHYNEVTDNAICLGKISFNDLEEGFIETIRLYNKHANKHLYDPQFNYKGKVYICNEIGTPSESGRGYTHYWCLHKTSATKMPVTWGMYNNGKGNIRVTDQYVCMIPKSKVNSWDWGHYIRN